MIVLSLDTGALLEVISMIAINSISLYAIVDWKQSSGHQF